MQIHFIAIGGSAMHNLAIALHHKGYIITGSDDEIFEPSRSRLQQLGLLPESMGWYPDKITPEIDAVILGMHARADNPELARAKELGIKVYSYPEFIYEQTKNKKRVVIGGSHGKTTITSMILHVCKQVRMEVDFMVGAQLEGFDCMVKLSESAPVVILEGDEYLSSPDDRRPKFHLYLPHIAVLSGIAWDHINVFPTFDIYVDQFRQFIALIQSHGKLFYSKDDTSLADLAGESFANQPVIEAYSTHPHRIEEGVTILTDSGKSYPIQVFGQHNLQNLSAAKAVCLELGIDAEQFYKAIASFAGASKRLELVARGERSVFYKDFAHSPSKLRATTSALKQQYPNRKLVACMELHTFSSLNKAFLQHYSGTMELADQAWIYYSPKTLAHKKLPDIQPEEVAQAFGTQNVQVFTDREALMDQILGTTWDETNLLMMTSGTFDGIDFKKLGATIYAKP
ncbi:MAG TPA: Mur ligase family protein [Luteibaculaceae bacterium]|nr:Mur ligase family protein [Luteibaculaceae bacterium]